MPRPVSSRSTLPLSARPLRQCPRAQGDGSGGGEPPKGTDGKPVDKMDGLLADLKKTGMDRTKAKQVLAKWGEMGVKDPEQLRKLLVKRSLRPAIGLGFQALLDLLAASGGYYTAGIISDSEPFTGQFPLQLLATFFGFYYVIQALLNLSVMGVVLLTAYKYGTNSTALLAAVQQMAGPVTGLNIADRAQVAVNTLKVLQTLDEIAELLKGMGTTSEGRSTLQNLSAYLTLSHARATYGFDPEQYGLSEREAGDVAYVFSIYDLNDDYRLELSELRKLCADLGKDLNDEELREGMRLLDLSGSGYVEFNEFVAWWVKNRPGGKAAAA